MNPPSSIYVVDDDPAVLHSLCFLLETEGHAVEAFGSGPELLAAFPGPVPSCIILDYVMPGIDGLEVFARLRKLAVHAPAVLITGHPDPRIRLRARDVGLPLMEKPITSDTFLATLAKDAGLPRA